jgi:hypothetical protein
MAITVGIFQLSGGGKSSSIVINPDGKYDPSNYQGMDPKTTVIVNSDCKRLPFPTTDWVEGKNLFTTSDPKDIIGDTTKGTDGLLQKISKGTVIKSVVLDTVNGIMVDTEMLATRKLSFDKWADLAKDIYEIMSISNGLRDDLIIYFMGHVSLYTDIDGNESKCLVTNGRKLEKIRLESKLPIVLFGNTVRGANGNNQYFFETQANRSTGKSPIGMFDEFKIPNSLSLVDSKIRSYYKI